MTTVQTFFEALGFSYEYPDFMLLTHGDYHIVIGAGNDCGPILSERPISRSLSIQVQTEDGRVIESYEAVNAAAAAEVVKSIRRRYEDPRPGSILDRVLATMQEADELGGPQPHDYITLMYRISGEAMRRAKACTDANQPEHNPACEHTHLDRRTSYEVVSRTTADRPIVDVACGVCGKEGSLTLDSSDVQWDDQ